MIGSISSLANMEYMLYGNTPGFGSLSAPSMMNNYRGTTSTSYGFNPYMSAYNMMGQYNPTFGQNISNAYTTQNATPESNSVFAGLTEQEKNALVNDYTKSLDPSQSLLGATAGAIGFSLLFHPRAIVHPIYTYKSFGMTKDLFKDLSKETTELAKAWADPKLNEVIRDAYTAMNRIDARSKKKKGLHIWRKPLENGEYKELRGRMEQTLLNFKAGDQKSVEELIKTTEELNAANVKNGFIPRTWRGGKNLIGRIFGREPVKIESALASANNETAIKEAVDKAIKAGKGTSKTYLQTLKTSGGGVTGGLFFLALEYLMGLGKIKDSFNKDSKTGWKQLGQTTVKGIGSAVGWAAGDALGTWGCAKLLAKAGTAVAPGIGTAIGAIAGMVMGSLACWLTGKITNKLVGQDVGDKVKAEQLASTNEGQVQLLQNTIQKIQKGEKVDPQAQMVIQKLMAQYSAA